MSQFQGCRQLSLLLTLNLRQHLRVPPNIDIADQGSKEGKKKLRITALTSGFCVLFNYIGTDTVELISFITNPVFILQVVGSILFFHLIGRLTSWKRFFVEGKLSLSLGGVILVLLSIVCSVGIYGYCGVPATLIIFEILPFLVNIKSSTPYLYLWGQFYQHFMQSVLHSFSVLTVCVCNSLAKKIGEKAAHKMLVKLTPYLLLLSFVPKRSQ